VSAASGAGARFVHALAEKDFERVATLLDPGIDFRALTPNRSWQARGPAQVIDSVLKVWLEDGIVLERVSDLRVEEFSGCQRVAYRLHGRTGKGRFLIDQQAYLEERDGLISWMRVLCAGFRSPSSEKESPQPRASNDNQEAIAAWDGPLFERFVRFREILTTGLGAHGEAALRRSPPPPGSRVLDIGCGFGDTTQRLAQLVGAGGDAVGVDAAPRFIELAREEAHAAGATNVQFHTADVQAGLPEDGFAYAFSRFGTMFFANPVVALGNIRRALRPGGRLCMVVWRRKLDNDWLHRAETVVERYLEHNHDSEEPTCGPGPFSMANADTTSAILLAAGFEELQLARCDIPICIGRDMDEAVAYVCALGPAGELIRLAGAAAEPLLPTIQASLREALAEFNEPTGVIAPASTWIVTATAPSTTATQTA
jgi:ubiquinone/menaquinone biosynthesis C-methylase UbiE